MNELSSTGFGAPATIDDGSVTNDLNLTPTITWTAVPGATSYEIAVGTTSGGTDVLTWTNVGNVTTYSSSTMSFTDGNTYFVSVRAKNSVLTSSAKNGDGFVVTLTYSRWVQEAYIKAVNANIFDSFCRVALSGDTLVVASTQEASNETTITNGTTASANNSASGAGAVYVYKRNGSTWAQQAYIKASNAETNDLFGTSIAISGDTIAASAIFESSNETTITNGTTSSADNTSFTSGAVYVYKRTGNNWAQQAYIKAANNGSTDLFGNSLSISEDTIVVGAHQDDSNETTITNGTTASANNAASESGAAYVYKRTGNNWAQQAYIKASNSEAGDQFGVRVKIQGDTIVVTSFEDSNETTITNGTTSSADNSATDSGAVYVYKRTGVNWAQEAYIKAANAEASDNFGISIGIVGDTLVVGGSGESSNQTTITNGTTASADNSATGAGAVYIYKRTGASWAQEAYIKASNAEASDSFGTSSSISGDTIVVGATGEDSNQTTITNGTTASSDNSATASGAAYVFKRNGTTWAQEAYIKASNADASDLFGVFVDLDGDTIAVGALSEDSNQTTITNGTTSSTNNATTLSGAVYVYKRKFTATPNWSQQAYIKAANAETNDMFGHTVSISEDTVVVGSDGEDSNQTTITNGTSASADNSTNSAGAAYVYRRTGTTWVQEAYIKAANAGLADFFGNRVSIFRDTIVIGAYAEWSNQTTITNGASASADNSAFGAGAAYIYKRTGSTWAQEAYIKAANAAMNDNFGLAVGISEDTIVVGAPLEDSNETTITNGTTASGDNSVLDSGAVYVYKRTGNNWAQEAYIKAANSQTNDWFGQVVAISGDTIAVTAIFEDSNQTTITNGTTASADNSANNSGAVYVYKRSGTTWAQQAYIKASNSEAGDQFGNSINIDRDTLVVGSDAEASNQTTITNGTTASADNSAVSAGAVYVYKRNGNNWAQEAYIKPSNLEAGDSFGNYVSIDRDTLVVAASGEDSNETTITNGATASTDNSLVDSGAVYVFKRSGVTWTQEAYIKASNADTLDYFGYPTAISGDTIVTSSFNEDSNETTITNGTTASSNNGVSASGAVYIYIRNYP